MADALRYIGIARMGGNLELGEENCKAAVKSGRARLLILASDTSPGAQKRAEGYVFGYETPILRVPYRKEELSAASGKNGCSMAALPELGLAERFARALAEEYGESYAPTAEALRQGLERRESRKGKSGNRRKQV